MFNYEQENNEYDDLEECVNDVYTIASKYADEGVKNGIGGPFGAGIIYKKEFLREFFFCIYELIKKYWFF